jgi:hypothetical protein
MKVRDTFKNFCELCWVALALSGLVWLLFVVLALVGLLGGVWNVAVFFGAMAVVYGGMLFFVSYLEARNHWKHRKA